jgi:hypothetical protein
MRQHAKDGSAVIVEEAEPKGSRDHAAYWGCSYEPKSTGSYESKSSDVIFSLQAARTRRMIFLDHPEL